LCIADKRVVLERKGVGFFFQLDQKINIASFAPQIRRLKAGQAVRQ